MNAFVAITDRDWFDFLAAREDVDEVNFCQPSAGGGRFRAPAGLPRPDRAAPSHRDGAVGGLRCPLRGEEDRRTGIEESRENSPLRVDEGGRRDLVRRLRSRAVRLTERYDQVLDSTECGIEVVDSIHDHSKWWVVIVDMSMVRWDNVAVPHALPLRRTRGVKAGRHPRSNAV